MKRVCAGLILTLSACSAATSDEPDENDCAGKCDDADDEDADYLIGAGIRDITGPAADLGMMGYAKPDQKTGGILTRLRARAFVVAAADRADHRVVFVSAELGQLFESVKRGVVDRLEAEGLGGMYGWDNVLLSATHTHSGPGGYAHHGLYNITIPGLSVENLQIIVDGITEAILQAHDNLGPGTIRVATEHLRGASANRSAEAYEANPDAHEHAADTNTTTTVLRLSRPSGEEVGAIAWYAVHATSISNDNRLISGDNKGICSYLWERKMDTDYDADETFVAACAQSDEGDVSPNVLGDVDGDGTWDGEAGEDDFESARISGERQYRTALAAWAEASQSLSGAVDFRHRFVDFSAVRLPDGRTTCEPGLGVSMLAGAEDGPGVGKEGTTCDAALGLAGLACNDCQGNKPVAVKIGDKSAPFQPGPATPVVIPVQLLRIGGLAVLGVPAEATTMAGRRMRETVTEVFAESAAPVDHVVIAGLANAYSGYVTTSHEYAVQHYEGASTHFGPHTLAAYQRELGELARVMAAGVAPASGAAPADLTGVPKRLDLPGHNRSDLALKGVDAIGGVEGGPEAAYVTGETVDVSFSAGHPNRDPQLQSSYIFVERRDGASWLPVAHDWDPSTTFRWERVKRGLFDTLARREAHRATVAWAIPTTAVPGEYRIRHVGLARDPDDGPFAYEGTTQTFKVHRACDGPFVDITADGSVSTPTAFVDHPAAHAIDGDDTTSWFASADAGARSEARLDWTIPGGACIEEITLTSNAAHAAPEFRQDFGFGAATVQVLDNDGRVLFSTTEPLAGTPDPDMRVAVQGAFGHHVVVQLAGFESPDEGGGFAELTIVGN